MLVDAAQKVVLEGCRFVDCTLVLVSGAEAELKNTEFTQGETSTYNCSVIASGDSTVQSMHGRKITGGAIGVTVYGGATAALTDVAVEQISVLGVEARDADTSVTLTRCSLQNFAANGRARTYAVHAYYTGSCMHFDIVHIRDADHIDYGVLVHTRALIYMYECTLSETKVCGAEISGGGTGQLTACQFERNELGVHVTGYGSCCDAHGCIFLSTQTGVSASRKGKMMLQKCHATEAGCAYRATSGAAMHTTECTSKGGKIGWRADMLSTNLIAQGCLGTDAQGPHVAGGATADLDGCSFSGSSREVVMISSSGTFADLKGCTVSKGEPDCVRVDQGARACLIWCSVSGSGHRLRSEGCGTRVDVIDCLSENHERVGRHCDNRSVCVVSGSRSVGNCWCGYGAAGGGHMTVTNCCSEEEEHSCRAFGGGSTMTSQRLRVDGVQVEDF